MSCVVLCRQGYLCASEAYAEMNDQGIVADAREGELKFALTYTIGIL